MYNFCRLNLNEKAQQIHQNLNLFTKEQINITNDLLVNILLNCRQEWVADFQEHEFAISKAESGVKVTCQLCGKIGLDEIYHIKNKLNGKRLRVGSLCIKEYQLRPFANLSMTKMRKEYQRTNRKSDISSYYPGLIKRLEGWDSRLKNYDVLIPNFLESEYLVVKIELELEINNYVEGKTKQFNQIDNLLNKEKEILAKLSEYNDKNKNQRFVVSRDIRVWLERNSKPRILEKLKNTGFVDSETIPYIHEANFVQVVLDIIQLKLKNTRFTVTFNTLNNQFVFRDLESNIQLKSSVNTLFSTFGEDILNMNNPTAKITVINIINTSEPLNSNSKRSIINKLKQLTNTSNIRILTEDFSDELDEIGYGFGPNYDYVAHNEINLQNNNTKMIIVEDLDRFLFDFKSLAFGADNRKIQNMINFVIKNGSKKYKHNELIELRTTDFNKREY